MKSISALAHPLSTRSERLDIFRGLAILLVVIGHEVQGRVIDFDHNLVFKGIYMFHMPLFFYISGMLYGLKPVSTSRAVLLDETLKKGRQLVIPFICWYIVKYIFIDFDKGFVDCFVQLYKSPDFGLWFLWVLFLAYFLGQVGKLICTTTKIPYWMICASFVVTIFVISNRFNTAGIGLLSAHLLYFLVGIFHQHFASIRGKYIEWFKVICTIAFPLMVFIWDRVHPIQIYPILEKALNSSSFYGLHTLYLLMGFLLNSLFAFVGIAVFFLVATSLAASEAAPGNSWLRNTFRFIGRRTLEIYAIHFYFTNFKIFPNSILLECIVSSCLAISISLIVSEYLLKPIPVASTLLLGGRR